jgi:hypothetical protein
MTTSFQKEIFIQYDQQLVIRYHHELSEHVRPLFAADTYQDEESVRKIIETFYDWSAYTFQKIMAENDDMLFVNYLFACHESSIPLWMRTIKGEDLHSQFGVTEDDLGMNRRIFKLALELTCDIDYTKVSKAAPAPKLFNQITPVGM